MQKKRYRLLLMVGIMMTACQGQSGGPMGWQGLAGDRIFSAAHAKGKPLLLAFETAWCPYCSHMEETVFRDPAVVELAKQFLCVRVDGDQPSADPLMTRYVVKGYPTFVFAASDGTLWARTEYDPSSSAFAARMREMLARRGPDSAWQGLVAKVRPEVGMADDPYWTEGEALEKRGDLDGAKAVYRRGGLALLTEIDRATSLTDVRSILSGTITLLRRGGALLEAAGLSQRAVEAFPNDFLYHHRYATVLKEQGDVPHAITEAERAFALSYGRNRIWVGDQLSELLVMQGDRDRALAVIREALAAVDWSTNTRKRELANKATLEERLAALTAPR